ncbi:hypothetical protein [Kitasatospora camelliae]|uniref:Uncharacterized protein n=1 Tax=Kitasatospora camelliae TaxID=3156397 RepID=A0AAU8JQU8_9ACTN
MSEPELPEDPTLLLLRDVLLNAVPVDLTGPPDRMARVRRRVRRTRRVRAAALCLPLAVAAVLLVPRASPGPDRLTVIAPPSPAGSPTAAPARPGLDQLYGLQLATPEGWYQVDVPAPDITTSPTRYLSPDPITPSKNCRNPCLPITGPGTEDVLVELHIEHDTGLAATAASRPAAFPVGSSNTCRGIKGARTWMILHAVGPQAPDAVLVGTACAALSDEVTAQLLTSLNTSVEFPPTL